MAAGLCDQQHPGIVQRSKSIEKGEHGIYDDKGVKIGKMNEKTAKTWNTENLGQRLAVDAGCAATAGALVAPIVSMVDK